ncbi:hypothetical protein HMPREF0321_1968 [Dermacoccus sp. Ellin185]|nr:hypothetical protein HMPREF0321_1968 [Dermacoccus sp. Ellin185]
MVAFKLCHGQQDGQHQPSTRRGRVEAKLQDAKTHSALLEVIHEFEDATNVAAEPIEAHDREDITRTHPRESGLQLGAVHPHTSDPMIDEDALAPCVAESIDLAIDELLSGGHP